MEPVFTLAQHHHQLLLLRFLWQNYYRSILNLTIILSLLDLPFSSSTLIIIYAVNWGRSRRIVNTVIFINCAFRVECEQLVHIFLSCCANIDLLLIISVLFIRKARDAHQLPRPRIIRVSCDAICIKMVIRNN